jgi:hypothetical protein
MAQMATPSAGMVGFAVHPSHPARGRLDSNSGAKVLTELVGNVTFLERPFHPATFISMARTALKGRQRQLEARARIEEPPQ